VLSGFAPHRLNHPSPNLLLFNPPQKPQHVDKTRAHSPFTPKTKRKIKMSRPRPRTHIHIQSNELVDKEKGNPPEKRNVESKIHKSRCRNISNKQQSELTPPPISNFPAPLTQLAPAFNLSSDSAHLQLGCWGIPYVLASLAYISRRDRNSDSVARSIGEDFSPPLCVPCDLPSNSAQCDPPLNSRALASRRKTCLFGVAEILQPSST